MKKNEFKNFIIVILLIIILFFALFNIKLINRQVFSIVILLFSILICKLLKKRNIDSIYKKQVNITLIIFAVLYITIYYLLGLYFGFVKSKVLLSIWSLFKYIIPLSIIIVSSEIIRYKLLSQKIDIRIKTNKINIIPVLTYISMVLIDLIIYTGVYDLTNINDFLTAMGFVLFASLSCNLLYNYMTFRFGCKGIILYRLLTTMYIYIIPVVPNILVFFESFIRMIYPYIIYLIIEKNYTNYNFSISKSTKKKELILNTTLICIITLVIMLVSCKFTYGILVIGSNSMSKTIDKGDAIIYETYKEQDIHEGQVIVFMYKNVQTIHRVVDVKEINGEIRYFTKGDANKTNDEDYRTNEDIIGITKIKIKHIGNLTLWVRELFSK